MLQSALLNSTSFSHELFFTPNPHFLSPHPLYASRKARQRITSMLSLSKGLHRFLIVPLTLQPLSPSKQSTIFTNTHSLQARPGRPLCEKKERQEEEGKSFQNKCTLRLLQRFESSFSFNRDSLQAGLALWEAYSPPRHTFTVWPQSA